MLGFDKSEKTIDVFKKFDVFYSPTALSVVDRPVIPVTTIVLTIFFRSHRKY